MCGKCSQFGLGCFGSNRFASIDRTEFPDRFGSIVSRFGSCDSVRFHGHWFGKRSGTCGTSPSETGRSLAGASDHDLHSSARRSGSLPRASRKAKRTQGEERLRQDGRGIPARIAAPGASVVKPISPLRRSREASGRARNQDLARNL